MSVSLDEVSYEVLEGFGESYDAPLSAVAAGLIRAALRAGLQPESNPLPMGRPRCDPKSVVYRQIAKEPRDYAELCGATDLTAEATAQAVAELLTEQRIEMDAQGVCSTVPKLIPKRRIFAQCSYVDAD